MHLCDETYGTYPTVDPLPFHHRVVDGINFTRLNSFAEEQSSLESSVDYDDGSSEKYEMCPAVTVDYRSIDSSVPIQKTNAKLKKLGRINKRKQFIPRKSPPADDPHFRGVTFNLKLEFNENESKIIIPHFYSGLYRLPRRSKSYICEGADDKHCASCGTNKTPLWRDAEDGTPLCNACGIRYKKYRERCSNCWRVPRKDGKIRIRCSCKSAQ